MKVLVCHNYYQQPGGEDQSFAAEAALLESHGHNVVRYTVHNDVIREMSHWDVARRSLWNRNTYDDLSDLIRRERPELMHCTNTFPLISPAAYDAARAQEVPVVQSLRNYRLSCPGAFFYRNGRVCEECAGKRFAWPGVIHKCYRGSSAATAVVATVMATHRLLGTWENKVDLFFTPSEFARGKLIEQGLPAEGVMVKPNFIDPDPGPGNGRGEYAAFVGRLAPEKGLDVLLNAWRKLEDPLPLKIVGDGPLRDLVLSEAKANPAVQWLGRQSATQVLNILGDALCLIMPSVWYETFGRTIIEAFSRGTPVIASRLGAMTELVEHGRTGWHFRAGDAHDLAGAVQQMLLNRSAMQSLRRAARNEYLSHYTAEDNLRRLMAIYEQAMAVFHTKDQHELAVAGS